MVSGDRRPEDEQDAGKETSHRVDTASSTGDRREINGSRHLLNGSPALQPNKNVEAAAVEGGGHGDADGGARKTGKFFFSRMSSRKKLTFLLLALSNFAACTCFSLMAPFFPGEAAAKGMPQSIIGIVFSCFEFWIFVASPVYGNFTFVSYCGSFLTSLFQMAKIGPRFAFIAGQFVAGGCSVLFGTLYLSPPGLVFIVLCLLLRTFMGLATSAFVTASFTLIANEFPDIVATVFGAMEVFAGLGYVVGPLIGGALFDVGGFAVPFYVMGAFLLLFTLATLILMPSRSGSMLRLLASPLIVVSCISVACGCYTFGFFDASLAIHLEQFSLSAFITGLLFMVVAATYALSCPVYGWIADKKKGIAYYLLMLGNFLTVITMMLIGPSPLLPFLKTELWLIILSLVLMGTSLSSTIIPALSCFYKGARHLGFQDGLDLDGMMSGLLNAASHGGAFLGPTVGNPLIQVSNYQWSATFNAGLCLFAMICLVIYIILEKTCLKYDVKENDVGLETSQLIQAPESNNHQKHKHYCSTDSSLTPQQQQQEEEL